MKGAKRALQEVIHQMGHLGHASAKPIRRVILTDYPGEDFRIDFSD